MLLVLQSIFAIMLVMVFSGGIGAIVNSEGDDPLNGMTISWVASSIALGICLAWLGR